MRCVSYARTTSYFPGTADAADPIARQNRHIAEYVSSLGWKVEKKYSDRKMDPAIRDGFDEMIHDGLSRQFDMIIVDSVYRFGPDMVSAINVLERTFYPAGIHFAVVEDAVCSLEMPPEQVHEYLHNKRIAVSAAKGAETCSKNLEEGFLRAEDERYGYLVSDDRKSFLPDEEAASVIRRIYQQIADGRLPQMVANSLNEENVEPPSKHLNRVGTIHSRRAANQWTGATVKDLVMRNSYTGAIEKQVCKQKVVFQCPAIIEEGLSDRARMAVHSRAGDWSAAHPRRFENAFFKRIVDWDTGTGIRCTMRNTPVPHRIFLKPGKTAGNGAWLDYETVEQSARKKIREEREKAVKALHWLESSSGREEKLLRIDLLRKRAVGLFYKMDKNEQELIHLSVDENQGTISSDVYLTRKQDLIKLRDEYEKQFSGLIEKSRVLESAFSSRNPWIGLYSSENAEMDAITAETVRTFIKTVKIKHMKTVSVELFLEEWKSYFPKEIIGEVTDGAKEQESSRQS